MSARLDAKGFDRAKRQLRGDFFKDARQRTAEVGKIVAVQQCPVSEPGRVEREQRPHLYETIRIEDPAPRRTELVAGDPGRDVHHAGFQEFGTTRNSATPYMGPATEQMERVFVDEAQREVRRKLGG